MRGSKPTILDPYGSHELGELAAEGVANGYLTVAVGMPLLLAVELVFRRFSGWADDDWTSAVVRYSVPAVVALVLFLLARRGELARRHPFAQAVFIVVAMCAIIGRSAHFTGGAASPFVVSLCTTVFSCSLLMPGGARYNTVPLLGGFAAFYGVLYFSGARGFDDIRSVAFAIFASVTVLLSLIFAELLERWRRRVATASSTDGLTTLLNRTYLMQRVEALHESAIANPRPVSMVMVDIDHFKQVNDTRGHGAGDRVIQRVSEVLLDSIRGRDLCGRMGGEEFLLVLDDCAAEQAREVGERLRVAIEELKVDLPGGALDVTVSIGVSTAEAGRWESVDAAIRGSDLALYASKHAGRNRVSVAPPVAS